MGSSRFVAGFIQRALAGPKYRCEISMRIVESDKGRMKAQILDGKVQPVKAEENTKTLADTNQTPQANNSQGIPPLRFGTINDILPGVSDASPVKDSKATGWTTVDAPLCLMYAGQIPYLADSLLQFPIANLDGTIVLSILPVVSRGTLLSVSALHYRPRWMT